MRQNLFDKRDLGLSMLDKILRIVLLRVILQTPCTTPSCPPEYFSALIRPAVVPQKAIQQTEGTTPDTGSIDRLTVSGKAPSGGHAGIFC